MKKNYNYVLTKINNDIRFLTYYKLEDDNHIFRWKVGEKPFCFNDEDTAVSIACELHHEFDGDTIPILATFEIENGDRFIINNYNDIIQDFEEVNTIMKKERRGN